MFPTAIDNTIRKDFVKCPTKAMYGRVMSLHSGEGEKGHLAFGHAFAKAMEVTREAYYFENCSEEEAVQKGIDAAVQDYGNVQTSTNKTLGKLPGAIRFYWDQWPLGEDGLVPVAGGLEVKFSIPIPVTHPDTGESLEYCGRFDMLACNRLGRYIINDEKTTTRLGNTWPMQWDMDSQLSGYLWAAKQPEFSVHNGIMIPADADIIGNIRAVSILLRDYGHAEVPVSRTNYMIEMWYEQMLRDVRRMVASYQSGEWDKSLGDACVDFGNPCEYAPLCKSPNPERLLDQYQVIKWSPLTEQT